MIKIWQQQILKETNHKFIALKNSTKIEKKRQIQ